MSSFETLTKQEAIDFTKEELKSLDNKILENIEKKASDANL